MRHTRRGRGMGAEFGGSGEDSFVAVVVTKLTGALLFILLLTMVIMALIPRANMPSRTPSKGESLAIVTTALPEAIAGRPYTVTLATRGATGEVTWDVDGLLPEGMTLDVEAGRISGTPRTATAKPISLQISARDQNAAAAQTLTLNVLEPTAPPPTQADARAPLPTLRQWLDAGFGYVILAALWIAGLGVVGSVERWSRGPELTSRNGTFWRFAGYRLVLTAATAGAGVALWFWTRV